MKKIVINNDNRRFNISSIVVGYLEENKEEVLEFEIPKKYAEYGKKACFSANGQTFVKNFDDIISNKLTITRDISQFKELDMTIAFFKIENEDEVVARTSILHILIENAIICDDDIKPDEPKIIILDNLIDEVTKLDVLVTKNEKKREEYYQEIQKKVDNGDLNGATFTPSVDTDGNISWSNDKNLSNPTTQNIKGPKGDTYNLTEQDKKDISSMTLESSESAFNQYYNDKLKDFNSNATSKTNDYNTNATNKTTEYNNNATSKVNEFNTNADNKIAEYDLHSQELNNKIVSTRNELERVKNDVLETGTDTDTFVHLEDSAMAEYQELSVDGVCEQETTTGKNLFDKNNTHSGTGVSVTSLNTGIRVTLTQASNYRNTAFVLGGSELLGKTITQKTIITPSASNSGAVYVFLGNQVNAAIERIKGTSSGTNTRQFSIPNSFPEGCDRVWVLFYGNVTGTANIGDYVDYTDLMFVEGSYTSDNFPTYEPYTGGKASPNPDYPQEIKTIENSLSVTSCNKNLFDWYNYNWVNQNLMASGITKNADGTITFTSSGSGYAMATTKIKLPKGTYSFNCSHENNTVLLDGSNALTKNSFVLTEEKEITIRVYISNATQGSNITISYMQIEKSNVATPYEQHLETQIQANLPEGEFIGKINDTYKDTLKVEYNEDDGQYHLKLYKIVYKNNSYNGESYNYYISTTSRKDGNIECGELQTGQVVYYVGNETIIDLGIVDMPITYNEITNLFTDSNLLPTINAKYYRNFISTIRNLQVNEKALKQELIDINTRLSALETAQTSVVSESEVTE